MQWYLYILKCNDDSLYTGITNNIEERVKKHNLGTGSKSLRGKLPVSLIYYELYNNRSEASIREAEVKKLTRIKKLKLVNTGD